ncbi:unnamed protein product [Amoebophrya sp. A120]|nr:unnamed protein product [Amoebophrya sp. A120]|eukprot:GSA120T00012633001.1
MSQTSAPTSAPHPEHHLSPPALESLWEARDNPVAVDHMQPHFGNGNGGTSPSGGREGGPPSRPPPRLHPRDSKKVSSGSPRENINEGSADFEPQHPDSGPSDDHLLLSEGGHHQPGGSNNSASEVGSDPNNPTAKPNVIPLDSDPEALGIFIKHLPARYSPIAAMNILFANDRLLQDPAFMQAVKDAMPMNEEDYNADCAKWRQALYTDAYSESYQPPPNQQNTWAPEVRDTREWLDPNSACYVPELIVGAWTQLVPLNPVPLRSLGVDLHPIVRRILHLFTLNRISSSAALRNVGFAFACVRSRKVLDRWAELMKDARYGPWSDKRLIVGLSKYRNFEVTKEHFWSNGSWSNVNTFWFDAAPLRLSEFVKSNKEMWNPNKQGSSGGNRGGHGHHNNRGNHGRDHGPSYSNSVGGRRGFLDHNRAYRDNGGSFGRPGGAGPPPMGRNNDGSSKGGSKGGGRGYYYDDLDLPSRDRYSNSYDRRGDERDHPLDRRDHRGGYHDRYLDDRDRDEFFNPRGHMNTSRRGLGDPREDRHLADSGPPPGVFLNNGSSRGAVRGRGDGAGGYNRDHRGSEDREFGNDNYPYRSNQRDRDLGGGGSYNNYPGPSPSSQRMNKTYSQEEQEHHMNHRRGAGQAPRSQHPVFMDPYSPPRGPQLLPGMNKNDSVGNIIPPASQHPGPPSTSRSRMYDQFVSPVATNSTASGNNNSVHRPSHGGSTDFNKGGGGGEQQLVHNGMHNGGTSTTGGGSSSGTAAAMLNNGVDGLANKQNGDALLTEACVQLLQFLSTKTKSKEVGPTSAGGAPSGVGGGPLDQQTGTTSPYIKGAGGMNSGQYPNAVQLHKNSTGPNATPDRRSQMRRILVEDVRRYKEMCGAGGVKEVIDAVVEALGAQQLLHADQQEQMMNKAVAGNFVSSTTAPAPTAGSSGSANVRPPPPMLSQ